MQGGPTRPSIDRRKLSWIRLCCSRRYEPSEAAPEAVGKTPDALPALRIEVTGMVTASNLEQFKAHSLAVFAAINTDLQTDQHFADAEKTVKWCGEVEDRLTEHYIRRRRGKKVTSTK